MKNGGHQIEPHSGIRIDQQIGCANAEIGAPAADFFRAINNLSILEGRTNLDIQPFVLVKTFPLRHVIAGKLKLMIPAQLQDELSIGSALGGRTNRQDSNAEQGNGQGTQSPNKATQSS